VTAPLNCQALFVFIQWAGNTTIGAATTLLLVRTIAVWDRSLYVIVPMLLLAAGQWGLLYYSQSNLPPFSPFSPFKPDPDRPADHFISILTFT
jgi:hypothetical protein